MARPSPPISLALLLAFAAIFTSATRLPDDQAYVTVAVKGARRYILQLADAPTPESDLISSLLGAAPSGSPASSTPVLPAPTTTGSTPPSNSGGSLGINRPATSSSPPPVPSSILNSNTTTTTTTTPSRTPPSPISTSTPSRTPPAPLRSSPTTPTINDNKVLADGSICDIYSRTSTIQCEDSAPACCTSATNSAICITYDSGADLTCVTSAPYPSCCSARDQPVSVCSPPTGSTCSGNLPVPGCCDSSTGICAVRPTGGSVLCNRGTVVACCPA